MKYARLIAIILLVYLGIGALVGAVPMILYPSQTQWGVMPVSLLQYSPFHSFLIPGLILLASNALLAFWVLWLGMARKPRFGLWTAFQGCVLLGWLVVECLLLKTLMWAHYLYGAVALVLIVTGLALRREQGWTRSAHG